ncbi:NADH-cytochrome b5 reductase 1 [Micractinium conductrix]|uniref:NADH-cytochrome b5 reductase n=1 Tax=Micractinium conductrix TaxID=554055 RepID=A0A2P6V2V2_9CHLO|nr:NADH-cytochrome b5 reductase 1 [Micractinium conductrix]|eukprot:PSC68419.1 NADH-cytochrome b5 reductase 1 [Micractinium conductrix]
MSSAAYHEWADQAALLVVRNLPQALFVVLVAVVLGLILKDALNGATRRTFLNPDKWQPLTLVDIKNLSHNTRRYRFALPHQEQLLGLPLGQHISIKGVDEGGREVMRPYTPTSEIHQRGHVDFVIKLYDDGQMSQVLASLDVGAVLLFKGPKGRFRYERGSKKAIGMIAGGSGITPMYQVAQEILRDPNDTTSLSLIYANVNEDDILLRQELDQLAETHSNFSVYYVLNNPPKGWQGGKGFVTADMIKKNLPAPGTDVLVLRCGPGPMNRAMEAHMDALGYTNGQQFQF